MKLTKPAKAGLILVAIVTARRLVIGLRVCLLEAEADRFAGSAKMARRYAVDLLRKPAPTLPERHAACQALIDANRFDDRADAVRAKIAEVLHAAP